MSVSKKNTIQHAELADVVRLSGLLHFGVRFDTFTSPEKRGGRGGFEDYGQIFRELRHHPGCAVLFV